MEKMVYDQLVAPVVQFMTSHVMKHIGYVIRCTKNVTSMREKMGVLADRRTDVISHKDRNKINNKEIPARVEAWLGEVEKVQDEVKSISSDGIGCLHIQTRYGAGRKASKFSVRIQELISEGSEFTWTDAPLATGIVTSSTSTPSSSSRGGSHFKSRDTSFKEALKFLQPDDNKSQVIALCGMGGVGKTTMMEQIKKEANDKKMFDFFVKVTIGGNPNMFSVQNDIAICMGGEGLLEATITARADSLRRKFEAKLEDNKTKILVILDDVWQRVNIKDIGLTSPLPKGVKLLLTSRDSDICTQIAADAVSLLQVVRVNVLSDAEAQNLFSEYSGVSIEHDQYRFQIGCDIVKKCGNLPLAIKLIGTTLNSQDNYVWRDTLNRLKNHDLDENVQEIIQISYEHVKNEEDKEIFLHCCLYPEDSKIPIEDFVRHAWGLKLFKNISTLREARDRTNTCVRHLVNANLLIGSDNIGCVKMHDLVLAFALARVSKDDFAWIVKHGDVSSWGGDERNESCKRISITCRGMSDFPTEFKYPNLSHIQLMDGDLSPKFPEDFYASMENLKVIAYYKMQYPLLPRSIQCLTNLKSLCLNKCTLMSDCSFIGDLVNLEVLSLAHCGIRKLPYTIGKLRNLKLLDLTGCVDLLIDDGIFIKLEKLEELYMIASYTKPIQFTDANWEELRLLSHQLCALEVEFLEKNQLKSLSFKKLDKFKMSLGCSLEREVYDEKSLYQNTLKLVTDRRTDLLDCQIEELFKKSEKLHLHVKDMSGLEDFIPVNLCDQRLFSYLRDFEVSNCENLKYLFPMPVAFGLRKLERLKISSCSVLESLIHDYGVEIKSKDMMINFEQLKFLSLNNLPKLARLFPLDNVVELPQLLDLELDGLPNFTSIYSDNRNTCASLFNSQVRMPKLSKLDITSMVNLEQIWPRSLEEEVDIIPMLRKVHVDKCHELGNLFPTNPIRLLNHLQYIFVHSGYSLGPIFNIDLECFGEVEQIINISLRYIYVYGSENYYAKVWDIMGGEGNSSFHDFDKVQWVQHDTTIAVELISNQPTPNFIVLRRGRGAEAQQLETTTSDQQPVPSHNF